MKFTVWQDKRSLTPKLVDRTGSTDYGLVWTVTRMNFYVHGSVVTVIPPTDPAMIPDQDARAFLTLWGSETNPNLGTVTDLDRMLTAQVDRVADAAPGEPCQFTDSIAC